MGFDNTREQTAYANAITPHDEGLHFAVFIQDLRAHAVAVLCAEFEDIAHFNAARAVERGSAFWAGHAFFYGYEVCDDVGIKIASHVDIQAVIPFFICARYKIGSFCNGFIYDYDCIFHSHWRRISGDCANCDDFLICCRTQYLRLYRVGEFGLIQLVIAAQYRKYELLFATYCAD